MKFYMSTLGFRQNSEAPMSALALLQELEGELSRHDVYTVGERHHDSKGTRCNAELENLPTTVDAELMKQSVARKVEEIFDILQIDHRNDHNTRDTPDRFARMFVDDMMRGRFCRPPVITEFENAGQYSQLIVSGPIEIRSTCAHHLMPIYGSAIIGVLPSPQGKIIGLSKYDRIVDHFSGRLQIQEELVQQIAKFIVDKTQPRGLAVRISAVHMCKTHRGVRATHNSRMVNSAYYGELLTNDSIKSMFLQECMSLECGPRR
jgi:GTP cyclohydrolase I